MTRPDQGTGTASGLAVIGAIVTTAANFFIAWLVSRRGAEEAGVFFVATAVATIAGNGASLGTQTGLVYFLPQALSAPGGLLRIAARPVALTSLAVALLMVALADPLARLVAGGSADLASMLRILAVTVPASALTTTLLGAARGLGTMTPTVLIGQVLRPGMQILLLGLVVLGREPSASEVAVAWSVPVVAALAASAVSVAHLGGMRRGDELPVTSAEYWHYTRPRSVSTALQVALERMDVILVSAFVGRELAGVYGALSRYVTAGNFLMFSVGQSVAPHLRRAISRESWTESGRLLQQVTGWLVLVAWPYFLLVALNPEPLARLLNDGYVDDARILTVLALGMMVSAAAGPVDLTLLMLGRSRASLAATATALVINVMLIVLLTPRLGIVGAAWAWSISVAVQNGLASVLVYRISALWSWARPATLAAVAAAGVVPGSLLARAAFGTELVGLLVAGLLSGLAVVTALGALRVTVGLGPLVPGSLTRRPAGLTTPTPRTGDSEPAAPVQR